MVYVRSQKFCCCLPVRFGVFVMTLAGTLFGGFVAVAAWIAFSKTHENPEAYDQDQKIGVIIQAVAYTLLALVSLFGFVGACSRSRVLVTVYSFTLWFVWVLAVSTGIYFLAKLWHASDQASVDNCVAGSTNDIKNTVCDKGVAVIEGAAKTAVTIVLVILWLIELYGCVIASSYVSQLREEEDAELSKPVTVVQQVVPAYPVATYSAPSPGSNNYAFSQYQNSYGQKPGY